MTLNSSGVSMESCVQFGPGVAMRFESDSLNHEVALYFGSQDEYVLIMSDDSLRQVLKLAMLALSDLDSGEK